MHKSNQFLRTLGTLGLSQKLLISKLRWTAPINKTINHCTQVNVLERSAAVSLLSGIIILGGASVKNQGAKEVTLYFTGKKLILKIGLHL